jgi:hypothetical protein
MGLPFRGMVKNRGAYSFSIIHFTINGLEYETNFLFVNNIGAPQVVTILPVSLIDALKFTINLGVSLFHLLT